jgi:hypothetical protein
VSVLLGLAIGSLASICIGLAAPDISFPRWVGSSFCLIAAIYLAVWYLPVKP